MRIHLPEAIGCLLLLATLGAAQDYEPAVRALRPVDLRPQEAALLDSLEREARAALDAVRALPHLRRLETYTLCDGFRSYRDFLNRPKSLEISYLLRGDNNDRFAYDREIPFFYIQWKGLLGPDIHDFLKVTKARGTWERAINGDWETRIP